MPMIDVYAKRGTIADPKALARDLAATLMKIEQVPDIPMFRQNTAGFVHDLPEQALSNVEGATDYVRVQVLTNAGALDREKQLSVVQQFTDLIAAAAGDPSLRDRTWVLLTEAVEGGVGPRRACEHQRGTRRCRPDADCRATGRTGCSRFPRGSLRRMWRSRANLMRRIASTVPSPHLGAAVAPPATAARAACSASIESLLPRCRRSPPRGGRLTSMTVIAWPRK